MQARIHNESVLTVCNTEIILMKESKYHSAMENEVNFESENSVPDFYSNRWSNKSIDLSMIFPCH